MGNTGQKPVTISICMMVKDEESNLKRCLPSLKDFNELIVVDTGSTDDTVSIAKSFGAKVFDHPFDGPIIDDFSKYRNLSMGYASGDWVFIIDADEELFFKENSSASQLKKWLADIPLDCMSAAVWLNDIQQNKKVMYFPSVRLFRRGSVKYDGIIHNAPKIINGKAEAVFFPGIYIQHYGYDLSPEMQAKKRERTESLLLKRIQQNPDDIAAYFYLIQSYTAYGDYEKAAEYSEKYKKVSAKTGQKYNGSIYCTVFHIYRKIGDKQKAKDWLLEGLTAYPEDLDLLMALTEFGVWTADVNLLSKGARGFIKTYSEYQKNPIAGGNKFVYSNSPESLAYCLFHLTMATFQEGCILLDKLKETLEKTETEFKFGITSDVNTIFGKFGLTKDDWNIDHNQPLKKVVNL